MPEMEKAVENYALDSYYQKAFELDSLRPRAQCLRSEQGIGQSARSIWPSHVRPGLPDGPALDRSRNQVCPDELAAVANGDPTTTAWDTHAANFGPCATCIARSSTAACRRCFRRLDQRGLLKETLVIAIGEFGRSPRLGVSTSGNGNSPGWPRSLALLLYGADRRRRHPPRRALWQI